MLDTILQLNGLVNNIAQGVVLINNKETIYLHYKLLINNLPKDRFKIDEFLGMTRLTIYKEDIKITRAEIENLTLEDLIVWYNINNNGGKKTIKLLSTTSIKNNQIIKTQLLKYLPLKTITPLINHIYIQHSAYEELKNLAGK